MYKPYDLKIFVDISTYCNAGCPQCHRTDPNGLGKAEWLPLIQWNIEQFKTAFPLNLLKQTKILNLCGTWGDPVMNKDIKEIVQYIAKTNPNTDIHINTNGSMRDEQWWWELGIIGGKNLRVVFAVDGTNQEMHEKYRRFTNLEKVLKNMKALSDTRATSVGHTILFRHNQDHIKSIKTLCEKNGATSYMVTTSDRFDHEDSQEGKYFYFRNEQGIDDVLEISTHTSENAFIQGTHHQKELQKEIKCRWKFSNRILVNIDGQVYPCCYIVNQYYKSKFVDKYGTSLINHEVMKEYAELKDEHNIFKNDLLSIIKQSKWFNQILPTSWTGNNPIMQCSRFCSSAIKKTQQLKEYI